MQIEHGQQRIPFMCVSVCSMEYEYGGDKQKRMEKAHNATKNRLAMIILFAKTHQYRIINENGGYLTGQNETKTVISVNSLNLRS